MSTWKPLASTSAPPSYSPDTVSNRPGTRKPFAKSAQAWFRLSADAPTRNGIPSKPLPETDANETPAPFVVYVGRKPIHALTEGREKLLKLAGPLQPTKPRQPPLSAWGASDWLKQKR